MEPNKQLSILLESSMEATIHDMLDYFLRLLYDKLERTSRYCGMLKDKCEALVTKWFQRRVETVRGAKDFSDMSMLLWWGRCHLVL